ncbi:putative defensin-like protein 118 [Mercurialis annua]|uniref:putative defensin-like protein 118 n=1 Tax=Mercurialis annua TaxID=3986 RepID=UPI00215EA973|nr:putative defensin-like protein 118 [Mercurialis annua]
MALLSLRHASLIFLVFSVAVVLMGYEAEATICRNILPRLPGNPDCEIGMCGKMCKFLHEGTGECIDVFKRYKQCMCSWTCK